MHISFIFFIWSHAPTWRYSPKLGYKFLTTLDRLVIDPWWWKKGMENALTSEVQLLHVVHTLWEIPHFGHNDIETCGRSKKMPTLHEK